MNNIERYTTFTMFGDIDIGYDITDLSIIDESKLLPQIIYMPEAFELEVDEESSKVKANDIIKQLKTWIRKWFDIEKVDSAIVMNAYDIGYVLMVRFVLKEKKIWKTIQ